LFIEAMLYSFAFGGNLSAQVLHCLDSAIDHRYFIRPKNLNRYLEILVNDQPEYILGMGLYAGRDQDKIRLELKCSNKFKNQILDYPNFVELKINPFLTPLDYSKLASGIGFYYCNLISYKIVSLIKEEKLKSSYTFLHIPKKFDKQKATIEIQSILAAKDKKALLI
jgi:pyrrolidone-carboxylate peptidase